MPIPKSLGSVPSILPLRLFRRVPPPPGSTSRLFGVRPLASSSLSCERDTCGVRVGRDPRDLHRGPQPRRERRSSSTEETFHPLPDLFRRLSSEAQDSVGTRRSVSPPTVTVRTSDERGVIGTVRTDPCRALESCRKVPVGRTRCLLFSLRS